MGPEDHNSEVKPYGLGMKYMLVHATERFSASKTRSVARTASIEIETSAASAMRDACCGIVTGV